MTIEDKRMNNLEKTIRENKEKSRALLGSKIRQALKEKGLSDGVLAKECGASKQLISAWLNGKCQIRFKYLTKMSNVTGIKLEELQDLWNKLEQNLSPDSCIIDSDDCDYLKKQIELVGRPLNLEEVSILMAIKKSSDNTVKS